MKPIIACCGLNCAACEARIATIANDDEMRASVVEKWKTQYNSPDISIEMINCTGCTEPGVKLGHCHECEIRKCTLSKGFLTCAECEILGTCETVKFVHQYTSEALENLKSLQ